MQYDLSRYVIAHQQDYQRALAEIQNGRKISHWMWYIFPQLRDLGKSPISQMYAIQNLEEAKAFLAHPLFEKSSHGNLQCLPSTEDK